MLGFRELAAQRTGAPMPSTAPGSTQAQPQPHPSPAPSFSQVALGVMSQEGLLHHNRPAAGGDNGIPSNMSMRSGESGGKKGKSMSSMNARAASVLENQRRHIEELEREKTEWKDSYEEMCKQMARFEGEHAAALASYNHQTRLFHHLKLQIDEKNSSVLELTKRVTAGERGAKAARSDAARLREAMSSVQIAYAQHRLRLQRLGELVQNGVAGEALSKELTQVIASTPSGFVPVLDASPGPDSPRARPGTGGGLARASFVSASRRPSSPLGAPPSPSAAERANLRKAVSRAGWLGVDGGGSPRRCSTSPWQRLSPRGSRRSSRGSYSYRGIPPDMDFAERLHELCTAFGIGQEAAAVLADRARRLLPEDIPEPQRSPGDRWDRLRGTAAGTRRSLFPSAKGGATPGSPRGSPRLSARSSPRHASRLGISGFSNTCLDAAVAAAAKAAEAKKPPPLASPGVTPVIPPEMASPRITVEAADAAQPMNSTLCAEQAALRAWVTSDEGVSANRSAVVANIARVKMMRKDAKFEELKAQLAAMGARLARMSRRGAAVARAAARQEAHVMGAHDMDAGATEVLLRKDAQTLARNAPDVMSGMAAIMRK